MGIFEVVKEFMVKVFWPFFKEYVWPFIREHIIEIINFIVEKLKKLIKDYIDHKQRDREREAGQKAEEAESKASVASSDADAEKYAATAQVWREVAEQYRRDNEELNRKLDEYAAIATKDAEDLINKTDITADFSGEKPVIQIGDKKKELPALPR